MYFYFEMNYTPPPPIENIYIYEDKFKISLSVAHKNIFKMFLYVKNIWKCLQVHICCCRIVFII